MIFSNDNIRRQDRLLDEERAMEIIKEGEYGVLSMQDAGGNGAYGVPINYVWGPGKFHLPALRSCRKEAGMYRQMSQRILLHCRQNQSDTGKVYRCL